MAARPGDTLVLGKDNPFEIFEAGPLKVSVLSVNAEARTVRLRFSRRAARPLLGGTIYGGVAFDGWGLVWTPGRGFTPVPPHSPLVAVLEEVARLQDLQEMLAVAPADEAPGISEAASRALSALQRSVAALQAAPDPSPLALALDSIGRLRSASERLTPTDGARNRELIETSRHRLAQVERTLATAVEEERRR